MYNSADVTWTLVAAFLVFFMQAGFALCEAGLTRAKNTGNILMKNMMDFCIGTPCYWLVGFGIMFAGSGALIGGFDPLIRGSYDFGTLPVWCLRGVPDCVLRHCRHHRFRLDGRAHEVQRLLLLLRRHQPDRLPHLRPLDLGRRLAGTAWLP